MKIAIHQPNFFPHFAFFEKMEMADVFVFLGHCQYEKNGFQNRFRVQKAWNTMSVSNKKETIREKQYLQPRRDWLKIKIKNGFQKLSYFDDMIEPSLWNTNRAIITEIASLLSIKTETYEDFGTDLRATARLVQICKTIGADEYIAGPSGKKYMQPKLFEEAGIKIITQEPTETRPILRVL